MWAALDRSDVKRSLTPNNPDKFFQSPAQMNSIVILLLLHSADLCFGQKFTNLRKISFQRQ
jgi:hypothetical protein